MALGAAARPEFKKLRFFISYTRDDLAIAIAVKNSIQSAMGLGGDAWMDEALRFGGNFHEEIQRKLDETNILVLIDHPGFYSGLEFGYFTRLKKEKTGDGILREIVPIFQGKPVESAADNAGINIGVPRDLLNMTRESYELLLKRTVDSDHRVVKFLKQYQEWIDSSLRQCEGHTMNRSEAERDLPGLVRLMQLEIFDHLKTTQDNEATLKPQSQITIRTNDEDLNNAGEGQIPDNATLTPVGTGKPMSIFGLPPGEITWGDFRKRIGGKFAESWVDAISKVITYSMQNQLEADNSQVIVSYDGSEAYRVLLTTGTRKFNGDREFNLYFVEYHRRDDYGELTLLVRGLGLCCRFRSLFLEQRGRFSSIAAEVASNSANPNALREFAVALDSELNLMRRDMLEAKLDDVALWLGWVDSGLVLQMSKASQDFDLKVRPAIALIRQGGQAAVTPGEMPVLVTALRGLEQAMRPLNAQIIAQMADKLKSASTPAAAAQPA
ncbi:MAG TPA: hypothetical protein VML19_30360 [Verrucomicrobiae bacterium]|nr:hypothetical protein [Verrucomicrobiae bacterium]